jgi:hypothetical protein
MPVMLRNEPDPTSHAAVPARGTIELHLREVAQLFDSFDPCPFYSRDLDADAEEYLVASVRELRHPPNAVVIHIDQPVGGADEPAKLETAIHQHFSRKVTLSTRELRLLLRRGWISLAIGLAFLVALLGLGEFATLRLAPGTLADILKESLVIGGWVAMWRPLEIFLYDWWPIAGERRRYRLLARLPISVRTGRSS